VNTSAARQWFSSCHVIAATKTHAITKVLLVAVFPVRTVTTLHTEDKLPVVYYLTPYIDLVTEICSSIVEVSRFLAY
jgi:hypothetical protein